MTLRSLVSGRNKAIMPPECTKEDRPGQARARSPSKAGALLRSNSALLLLIAH